MIEVLLLAGGLAMDATAAAAGLGASERSIRPVIVGALLFGLFQGGMAGLGWAGGVALTSWAAALDHWIAFVLLGAIGGHMVYEAWSGDDEEAAPRSAGILALVGLAVATSIDALAAGVTLPVLDVSGLVAIGTIGAVTLALSLVGGALGRSLGDRLGSRLEIAGGLVLVGIGTKVLIEHLLTGT